VRTKTDSLPSQNEAIQKNCADRRPLPAKLLPSQIIEMSGSFHKIFYLGFYGGSGLLFVLGQGWLLAQTLATFTKLLHLSESSPNLGNELQGALSKAFGLVLLALGYYFLLSKSEEFFLQSSRVRLLSGMTLFVWCLFGEVPQSFLLFSILDVLGGYLTFLSLSSHLQMSFMLPASLANKFWKWLYSIRLGSSFENGFKEQWMLPATLFILLCLLLSSLCQFVERCVSQHFCVCSFNRSLSPCQRTV
jgi:hypothetical protein